MPSAGDTIGYRFRLIRELGHGSMGTVWLAWHLTLEVPCAVKFIVSEGASDAAYRTRFDTEARATARLRSPNVVRLLDHSLSGDEDPYIAMELLDGEDLRARLTREGRLNPRATCELVCQVARGLAEAHSAGIVHRDLKPENIFLAREREQEVVKILDFGVARWNARTPVDEGVGLIGTVEYMSPEVASGAFVDHRSDLWALSVIAYECLTGSVPFTGESIQEVLGSIKGGVARVPSALAPELGPDFDRWWTRATSRAIEDRFDGAEELARALQQAVGLAEGADSAGEALRAGRPEDPASLAPVEGVASSTGRATRPAKGASHAGRRGRPAGGSGRRARPLRADQRRALRRVFRPLDSWARGPFVDRALAPTRPFVAAACHIRARGHRQRLHRGEHPRSIGALEPASPPGTCAHRRAGARGRPGLARRDACPPAGSTREGPPVQVGRPHDLRRGP